jgi:GTP-binding protein HflX
VLAEDRLFATLDPTSRRVRLPGGLHAIVTDTVGFIHKLPHQLVDAFRATLEEVSRADLLLEVVDASDHHALEHRATVQAVLDELGAAEKPRIVAANKIDAAQMHAREIDPAALGVSAETGLGLGPLRSALEEALQRQGTPVDLRLPYTAVGEVEAIRARGGIQVAYDEDALHVTGFATPEMASELKRLKRSSTAKLL